MMVYDGTFVYTLQYSSMAMRNSPFCLMMFRFKCPEYMLIGDSQPSLLTGGVADQQIGWPRSGQWGRYI